MSKRQEKQELQQDEFIEFSHKLGEWLNANKSVLLLAFSAAVLAIAAGVYVRGSAAEAETRRFESFTSALGQYGLALQEYDVEKRRDAMSKAEKSFSEFAADNKGPLARRAVYMAGNAWFNRGVDLKNYEEAQKLFERCLREAETSEERARAYIAIGYCLESKAFLSDSSDPANKALAAYESAAKEAGETWMKYEAKVAQARVLTARGLADDEKRALKLLSEVKNARKPEPPAAIFAKGADMNDRERELLTQALTLTSQAGLAKSAELLELRVKGMDYEAARVAAGNAPVEAPAAPEAPAEEPAPADTAS